MGSIFSTPASVNTTSATVDDQKAINDALSLIKTATAIILQSGFTLSTSFDKDKPTMHPVEKGERFSLSDGGSVYMEQKFSTELEGQVAACLIGGVNPVKHCFHHLENKIDETTLRQLIESIPNLPIGLPVIKTDWTPSSVENARALIKQVLDVLIQHNVQLTEPSSTSTQTTEPEEIQSSTSSDAMYRVSSIPDLEFTSRVDCIIACCLVDGVDPLPIVWPNLNQ